MLARAMERGTEEALYIGSSVPHSADLESERLQSRRLRVYALTVAVLSGMFFPLMVIADTASGGELRRFAPASFNIFNVLGSGVGLAVWFALGRVQLSAQALKVADFALSLWFCSAWTAMTFSAHPEATVGYFSLLAYSNTLILRAGLLVSRYERTLLVTGVCALVVFLGGLGFHVRHGMPAMQLWAVGVLYATWTLTTLGVTTVISAVIFGLRRVAQRAQQLGQYQLETKIGQGGMGRVYRAKHTLLRRPTAVKLLSPNRVDAKQRARFEQEAQVTSALSHPNTIAIFDFGRTPHGEFYYAMEYVDGPNLQQLVEWTGALPPARVIHIVAAVCGALAEAHAAGLVHRDVKPANILLRNTYASHDLAKLCDFGLVKELQRQDPMQTQENQLAGTPLYMAPETIREGVSHARSDLYSLGAVAYFLLCGRPVFSGKSTVEVCAKHLHEAPAPPSASQPVPADLEVTVMRCLQKDPGSRPVDALALQAALLSCQGAGDWTGESSRQWWQKHGSGIGDSLEFATKTVSSGVDDTLLIDFRSRAAHGVAADVEAATEPAGQHFLHFLQHIRPSRSAPKGKAGTR